MDEPNYQERLKLFKEEDEGQDHYFIIVDEEGNHISSVGEKWYPIKSGYLEISISSLTNLNYFTQRERTQNKDEEIERDHNERLEGEGKLQSGTSNTGSPNISHFGNTNKYDEITVIIRGEEVEQDHFSLFGSKSDVGVGYSWTEDFTLDVVLNKERFKDLREIVNRGSIERVYIHLWLGNIPGLYSRWWSYEGSSFGDIKYFDYENPTHILNKEEFDEKYIDYLSNHIDPDLGSGIDFTISTREKVGGFSIPKTSFEKERLEIMEGEEDFFDDTSLSEDEKEDIRRNEEINIEREKLSTQISIFWGIVTIGVLLLLTLWFQ
jgi:hypothetical protein